MIWRHYASATVVLLTTATSSALAAMSPIGEAKKVVPSASNIGESGNLTLSVGSTVFQDDLVNTGPLGRAGLQFLDATQLEVGPNSSAKLDRFVFNPDKSASEASISLAKGVFRFVSGGHNRPNTYTITTPHATLGIRGTIIRLTITSFRTDIVVEEGFVDACSKQGGGCRELSPTLPTNAGTFTVTGFVRDFAFNGTGDITGVGTVGALGDVGSSSPPPPPTRRPSGQSSSTDITPSAPAGGSSVVLQDASTISGGSEGLFPVDVLQAPRISESPSMPNN
jgi:hypothetical protein